MKKKHEIHTSINYSCLTCGISFKDDENKTAHEKALEHEAHFNSLI